MRIPAVKSGITGGPFGHKRPWKVSPISAEELEDMFAYFDRLNPGWYVRAHR